MYFLIRYLDSIPDRQLVQNHCDRMFWKCSTIDWCTRTFYWTDECQRSPRFGYRTLLKFTTILRIIFCHCISELRWKGKEQYWFNTYKLEVGSICQRNFDLSHFVRLVVVLLVLFYPIDLYPQRWTSVQHLVKHPACLPIRIFQNGETFLIFLLLWSNLTDIT